MFFDREMMNLGFNLLGLVNGVHARRACSHCTVEILRAQRKSYMHRCMRAPANSNTGTKMNYFVLFLKYALESLKFANHFKKKMRLNMCLS